MPRTLRAMIDKTFVDIQTFLDIQVAKVQSTQLDWLDQFNIHIVRRPICQSCCQSANLLPISANRPMAPKSPRKPRPAIPVPLSA